MGGTGPTPPREFFRPPQPRPATPPAQVPSAQQPPVKPEQQGSGAKQAVWVASIASALVGAIYVVSVLGSASAWLPAVIGVVVGVAVYFAPCLIARNRNHPRQESIMVVNLFLGWTLVGWVVALAWACTAPAKKAPAPKADGVAS